MNQPTDVDRVLRTRLESMNLVLAGLQELSQDVRTARKGLDDLQCQVNGYAGVLVGPIKLAGTLRGGLDDMARNMELYGKTENEEFLVKSEDLRTQCENARELKKKLEELQQSVGIDASRAVQSLRRWSPLARRQVDIDLGLRTSVGQLGEKLKTALGQPKPWDFYIHQVQGACDQLFGQYVDLVGGIALRDQGLDRRVSLYADELVTRLLDSFGDRGALAVPSRHTREALIQAQHVRIPLPPGWTLWSLPLAARGVGELLCHDRDLASSPLPHLMPDAFGTFVTGPAYALAAILLELDPRTGDDQERAAVILHVLRQLDEDDDNHRFSGLADEIEQQWNAATTALTPEETTPATAGKAAFGDLFRLLELDPGTERDQERAAVILHVLHQLDKDDDNHRFSGLADEIEQQWNAATMALTAGQTVPATADEEAPPVTADEEAAPATANEAAFDGLFRWVEARFANAAYRPEDHWDVIEELSTRLSAQDREPPGSGTEIRDVLNAMWYARWQNPDVLDTIDKRATQAAQRPHGGGGEGGGPAGAAGRMENRP